MDLPGVNVVRRERDGKASLRTQQGQIGSFKVTINWSIIVFIICFLIFLMVNDNGMINGQYSIKDCQGSFFVNGHYSSHINETNFCSEFYLEMVQTLFCACLLYCSLSVDHTCATIAHYAAISSSSSSPPVSTPCPHTRHTSKYPADDTQVAHPSPADATSQVHTASTSVIPMSHTRRATHLRRWAGLSLADSLFRPHSFAIHTSPPLAVPHLCRSSHLVTSRVRWREPYSSPTPPIAHSIHIRGA